MKAAVAVDSHDVVHDGRGIGGDRSGRDLLVPRIVRRIQGLSHKRRNGAIFEFFDVKLDTAANLSRAATKQRASGLAIVRHDYAFLAATQWPVASERRADFAPIAMTKGFAW